MKVCGIGMWRIASGPLLMSLCFVAVCLHINNELAPNSHFARRSIRADMGVSFARWRFLMKAGSSRISRD